MMTSLKLCTALAVFILMVICSTHGFFTSEFQMFGSESTSVELSVPAFSTRGLGDSFSMCKADFVDSPIHISEIKQNPPNGQLAIVQSVEIYTCDDLLTVHLRECDKETDVDNICKNSQLISYWVKEPHLQQPHSDHSNMYAANAVLIRVAYIDSEPSNTPAIGVMLTHIESNGETGHFASPEVFRQDPWKVFETPKPAIKRDHSWKVNWPNRSIGQTSGVAILDQDYVFVFHRGDRIWDAQTFKSDFSLRNKSFIDTDTILKCKIDGGECVSSMGKDQFMLPHGITVTPDKKFLLLTDVGRHQVSALRIEDGNEAMVLGTLGVPKQGNDPNYFCQPADAEMDSSSGKIFVADGYCNARVAVFNNDGSFNTSIKGCFGKEFAVVHDLAIDQSSKILFAADRENRRICVYSIDSNSFGKELNVVESDGRMFSVDYNTGEIYTAEVKLDLQNGFEKQGFGTVMPTSGKFEQIEQFFDSQMNDPHDLTVIDNKIIFVSDLQSPMKVFKFIRNVPGGH